MSFAQRLHVTDDGAKSRVPINLHITIGTHITDIGVIALASAGTAAAILQTVELEGAAGHGLVQTN